MPEELFVAQENENGDTVYVNIADVEDYALPDELIEESAKFKSMNKLREDTVVESKKYKRRAQKAESALETPDEEEPATPPTPEPLSVDAIYAEIRERMHTEDAQARAQLEKKNEELKHLLETHKLPDTALEVLRGSSDPVTLAKYLGAQQYDFGETGGGETADMFKVNDDVFAGVYANLGLGKK